MRNYSVKKISRYTNSLHRAIKEFFIGSVIFLAFVVSTGFVVSETETKYRMNGIVDSVSGNEIVIEDSTGNLWLITGDKFQVGEKVRVTFFTNFTDYTREDDEIVKVKRLDKSNTKW